MRTNKIAIVSGASKKADSTRGIGTHNLELFKAMSTLSNNKEFASSELNRGNNLSDYEIVHFTSFRPFFISLPFFKSKKQKWILTIHDLIPLIYPKIYKSGIRGKINFLINKLLIKKYVDKIITISETSKKDICRFLEVEPNIVKIIYLAPKSAIKKLEIGNKSSLSLRDWKLEIKKRFGLPNRFVLYTGDINYNKNIPNLIKACKIAKIPLVIAGKQGVEIEKMDLNHSELIHLKNINLDNVIRLGYVNDEDLNDLYNLAYCYAQVSFYEGFGLPVVEAVTCNTPLVVSKTQCLVEVLGDNLTYVDPKSPEEIAKSILNPNKNVKLPREYSWVKTANETLNVYRTV